MSNTLVYSFMFAHGGDLCVLYTRWVALLLWYINLYSVAAVILSAAHLHITLICDTLTCVE